MGASLSVTLTTPSDRGNNSPPSACRDQAQWRAMIGHDFLIPIYDKIVGNRVQVAGFALFTFEGCQVERRQQQRWQPWRT